MNRPWSERQGFRVKPIASFPRSTPLLADVTGWVRTFVRVFMGLSAG